MVVPCKGRRKTTRTLIRHGKSLKIPSAAFHLLLSLASLCLGSEKAPPTHPGIGEEGGGEGGHGIEDEEEDEYDEEDGSGEGEDGGRANGEDATLSNLDDSNLQATLNGNVDDGDTTMTIRTLAEAVGASSPPNCHRPCPVGRFPVCASDGRTFPSVCALRNEGCFERTEGRGELTVARMGPC